MKRFLLFTVIAFSYLLSNAQKVDSIYFHLYTDSLKKGTHNYINVDGKLSNGVWKPLTTKEINFTTTYGTFEGNDLVLPEVCTVQKLTVKAVLISDLSIWKEATIWIKKKPDAEFLPTTDEILKGKKTKSKRGN